MNTPTHLLMTAALRKAFPKLQMVRSAVLWGSVAPDIPLYLLSFGGLVYFQKIEGWTLRESAQHIFDRLYFHDPMWIALHNFFHSPLNLLLLLVISRGFHRRLPRLANWMRWFLYACMLHSAVDIVTHYDDGPLLLWPLNWQWRFSSPISYWDHRHYGRETARFELAMVLGLLLYLIGPWFYQRTLGRWLTVIRSR